MPEAGRAQAGCVVELATSPEATATMALGGQL